MAEPPQKRPKRSNMDAERARDVDGRQPRGARDRDRGARDEKVGRSHYDRDSHRERDRRYRSRSRERERDRDRDRERPRRDGPVGNRGGRRDDAPDRNRDKYGDGGRGGRRDEGRDRDRDLRDTKGGTKGGTEGERDRGGRKRHRNDDDHRRDTRSRSPIRDNSNTPDARNSPAPPKKPDNSVATRSETRTATPPVAFKVGPSDSHQNGQALKERHGDGTSNPEPATAAHDPNAMDTDVAKPAGAKPKSKGKASKRHKVEDKVDEDEDDIVIEEDDSMAAMQAMLGFGGFGSTKETKVTGNNVSGVRKEKKTEYRQYMNRVGGFNRPLSPGRD